MRGWWLNIARGAATAGAGAAAVRRRDAWQPAYPDGVRPPYRCSARHLRRALLEGVAQSSGREIDADAWGSSSYQPTPTIIEAARELYASTPSKRSRAMMPALETCA